MSKEVDFLKKHRIAFSLPLKRGRASDLIEEQVRKWRGELNQAERAKG